MSFSITSKGGNYKLQLKNNITYSIKISYLGFQSISDTLNIETGVEKNYSMIPNKESLEEILLTERVPVKITEDTIAYRVEKFIDGSETKLRDILEKLTGIEVDSNGNVKVNGKAVNKLLVDGKEFFTGDEKLGVKNIPAGVVDEVVALDNYNDVSFLKGLSDSEQLALNIKLKDNKKKFAFGDLGIGGGIKERYSIHPTLFYYNPKYTLNVIGDFNNIGNKEFSAKDYLEFEGGFERFSKDPSSYFTLLNDDFAQFLSNDNFVFNKNNFGAVNASSQLSTDYRLNAYSIISSNRNNSRSENELFYITEDLTNENRITTSNTCLLYTSPSPRD